MAKPILGSTPTPLPRPPSVPAGRSPSAAPSTVKAVASTRDAFAISARTSSPAAPSPGGPNAAFLSLVGATQPQRLTASGYVASFGAEGRAAYATVDGQPVRISSATPRAPSFHAEAGKPLTVKLDPSKVSQSAEKLELVWRVVPGGEEQRVPLTDGTRDASGKLIPCDARVDVPAAAFGLVRLSIETTSAGGKVSSQWDPSSDAHIAPREGATVSFGDDWTTATAGAVRAGDALRLDYDLDRMTAMNGGVAPSQVTAFVSFNGEPPVEVPLKTSDRSGAFVPSIRIPFEATSAQIWFRGDSGSAPAWDSAEGKNFHLKVGPARDDADPSWKNELLRSKSFPNLREENFAGIGPATQSYNCIAWTLGLQDEWVWPGTTIPDFDTLYGQHGFRPLDTVDLSHDPNVEKVVVYALPPNKHGEVEVTHGARMDDQGRLTSKIGTQPLIRHNTAHDLAGPSYGEPVRVYVRPKSGAVS